jgi:hypothetical protein
MLRVYGRTRDTLTGAKTWHTVVTDQRGFDDMVFLTNLVQVLKLNLGESPFFADWGIPAHESVVTQIYPDYYVALTQQRFASHFMSLLLEKRPDTRDETGRPSPTYHFEAVTNYGATLVDDVPV